MNLIRRKSRPFVVKLFGLQLLSFKVNEREKNKNKINVIDVLCCCAVGVVGFEQPTYTFEEDAGMVDVCVGFLQPTEIDSRVRVNLLGSTTDGTAAGE